MNLTKKKRENCIFFLLFVWLSRSFLQKQGKGQINRIIFVNNFIFIFRISFHIKPNRPSERERERDGSETESGSNAAQPHSEPPKGIPEAHEPNGVAVAATRFLPLRSDQSHRQRPRRPAPLPTVASCPAFTPSEYHQLPLYHHALSFYNLQIPVLISITHTLHNVDRFVFAFVKLRYTETGFTVNGVEYEGGLLCVGNMLMSWAPKKFQEVTPDRYVV